MSTLALIHLIALLSTVLAVNLPNNWKMCSGRESTDQCTKEAVKIAFANLIKGVNILDIPPFDPLLVDKTTLKDSGSGKGPLSIKMVLSNYTITGFKSGQIDDIRVDCKKRALSFNVTMKEDVTLKGRYVGSGKVLLLPVIGDGDFKIIFKGYKLGVYMAMSHKNGSDHLKLDNFKISLVVRGSHSNFDNLYNGNKLLGNSVNQVFNENWRALLDELTPSMNKDFGQFLSKYAKAVVEKIPADAFC